MFYQLEQTVLQTPICEASFFSPRMLGISRGRLNVKISVLLNVSTSRRE